MVKMMDCWIIVSEFEFQLSYYINFQTNTHEKSVSPFILPDIG